MRSVRNCSVCVLGGAGFLGSHMVNHLIEDRGCNVLVIDNLVVGRKDFIHPKAKFIHHDITGSEDYLRKIFVEHKIKFVKNYIAFPYIPDSFARPLHVFNVNATGALKVINAAQEAGCEGILQVSSAEIYGGFERSYVREFDNQEMISYSTDKIREDTPIVPHSTYGASKAAIDAMVQVRWREAKTPVLALRQFNCVGERDVLHPYVIPEIINQLSFYQRGSSDIQIFLGNNSTRDFLYAGDAVKMAVELLEKGQFGEVYNLGSEYGIKIYELALMIAELMGFDPSRVKIVQDKSRMRPWEIWHLLSDNSKIHSVIDGRPMVTLKEALKRTIQDLLLRK